MSEHMECRFGEMLLILDKANLLVEDHTGGRTAHYTVSLRTQFPMLAFECQGRRFWRLLRWGSFWTTVISWFLAIKVLQGNASIFLVMLGIFGVIGFIASFADIPGIDSREQRKKTASWFLIDYESGNSFGIPQKRGLTAVQAAFLRELEAALKHYSLFETMSKGITCGWVPDAFEVLDRLKTEGILSEEEFQTCKQRRIERITNSDSGR
ncbi:hypothetical protein [uncultured Victivallis sp.]|uniref:hypothetical protein n=1 Tax=uncultured Victivallis sp. TaxID=354118 RepID=UPI00258D4783|nr:hypothetical protein [uncultured Victivallis sp.]